jgi:hypothetical protein
MRHRYRSAFQNLGTEAKRAEFLVMLKERRDKLHDSICAEMLGELGREWILHRWQD